MASRPQALWAPSIPDRLLLEELSEGSNSMKPTRALHARYIGTVAVAMPLKWPTPVRMETQGKGSSSCSETWGAQLDMGKVTICGQPVRTTEALISLAHSALQALHAAAADALGCDCLAFLMARVHASVNGGSASF